MDYDKRIFFLKLPKSGMSGRKADCHAELVEALLKY